MRIEIDQATLKPLVEQVIREALDQLHTQSALPDDRIGYTEPEAAALLGVAAHVLRDARRREEITAKKLGKRWIYFREDLVRWFRLR